MAALDFFRVVSLALVVSRGSCGSSSLPTLGSGSACQHLQVKQPSIIDSASCRAPETVRKPLGVVLLADSTVCLRWGWSGARPRGAQPRRMTPRMRLLSDFGPRDVLKSREPSRVLPACPRSVPKHHQRDESVESRWKVEEYAEAEFERLLEQEKQIDSEEESSKHLSLTNIQLIRLVTEDDAATAGPVTVKKVIASHARTCPPRPPSRDPSLNNHALSSSLTPIPLLSSPCVLVSEPLSTLASARLNHSPSQSKTVRLSIPFPAQTRCFHIWSAARSRVSSA